MELLRLPPELLEMIITLTMPEGFESMALACRELHALCTPFIETHNRLHKEFHNFNYHVGFTSTASAICLIARLAVEPIAALYIQEANFGMDGPCNRACVLSQMKQMSCRDAVETWGGLPEYHGMLADRNCGEVLIRMLDDSHYLKETGIDGREYLAKMEEEERANRGSESYTYSQYAATFVLTLLPNVKKVYLPVLWKPCSVTNKLIDVIARKAGRSRETSSLARLVTVDHRSALHSAELNMCAPLLAMPSLRRFHCSHLQSTKEEDSVSMPQSLCIGAGKTLRAVSLGNCYIDHVGIAQFLKCVPCLENLFYRHNLFLRMSQQWDICSFINAIAREAAANLVELSIFLGADEVDTVFLTPGRASMRGFKRLKRLEFDLAVASCNLASYKRAAIPGGTTAGNWGADEPRWEDSILGSLVPSSVTQLSLLADESIDPSEVLDAMFHDFGHRNASKLPNLREISLQCGENAEDVYKDRCTRLLTELEREEVVISLREGRSDIATSYERD